MESIGFHFHIYALNTKHEIRLREFKNLSIKDIPHVAKVTGVTYPTFLEYAFFLHDEHGGQERILPEGPIEQLYSKTISFYPLHIINRRKASKLEDEDEDEEKERDKEWFYEPEGRIKELPPDRESFFILRGLKRKEIFLENENFTKAFDHLPLFAPDEKQKNFFFDTWSNVSTLDLNEREIGSFIATIIHLVLLNQNYAKQSNKIEEEKKYDIRSKTPQELNKEKNLEKKKEQDNSHKKIKGIFSNPFSVTEEDPFTYSKAKRIRVDRVVYFGSKPYLFYEDKKSPHMQDGILQNFDQMRTYSLFANLPTKTYLFGVVSNLENWVFTCYRVPENHVTTSDFFVTKVFSMKIRQDLNKICNYLGLILFCREYLIERLQA